MASRTREVGSTHAKVSGTHPHPSESPGLLTPSTNVPSADTAKSSAASLGRLGRQCQGIQGRRPGVAHLTGLKDNGAIVGLVGLEPLAGRFVSERQGQQGCWLRFWRGSPCPPDASVCSLGLVEHLRHAIEGHVECRRTHRCRVPSEAWPARVPRQASRTNDLVTSGREQIVASGSRGRGRGRGLVRGPRVDTGRPPPYNNPFAVRLRNANHPGTVGSQNVTNRNSRVADTATAGFIPAAVSPAAIAASTTPNPPGVGAA